MIAFIVIIIVGGTATVIVGKEAPDDGCGSLAAALVGILFLIFIVVALCNAPFALVNHAFNTNYCVFFPVFENQCGTCLLSVSESTRSCVKSSRGSASNFSSSTSHAPSNQSSQSLSSPPSVVPAVSTPTTDEVILALLLLKAFCGDLTPRVQPGQQAVLNTNLRLRAQPTTSSRSMKVLSQGSRVLVLEGPECSDGYYWFKIDFNGQTGWVAAGGDGSHWLLPR